MEMLRSYLKTLSYMGNYLGHFFCWEAATSARETGLTYEEIQFFGRLKLDSYRLYMTLVPPISLMYYNNINASCTFAQQDFASLETAYFPDLLFRCLGVFGVEVLLFFGLPLKHSPIQLLK